MTAVSSMTSPREASELVAAVARRLEQVADALGIERAERSPGRVLDVLAKRIASNGRADEAWLVYVGLTATFPNPIEFASFRQLLQLSTPTTAILAVLEGCLDSASRPDVLGRTIEIVSDEMVVDVNFCATHEHNTGIQRVVRETVPVWVESGRPIRLVAWSADSSAMREIDEYEEDRVLHWNDRRLEPGHVRIPGAEEHDTIVVPWRTHVFLPEVPMPSICAALACLAESSGNTVGLIGYDAIPLVSADTQPAAESERFAHYLTIVKHAKTVVGISDSAATEFEGFKRMLGAQGFVGPDVHSVPLAVDVPAEALAVTPAKPAKPVVLCVGSHEARKNQDAVLFAGEVLYSEGHDFTLVFVGRGSRAAIHDFDTRAKRLQRKGFDVRSHRSLADRELWSLYAQARFTVFVSLHEGFGLPVAESLALHTPALTSDFGSLAEIAALGGCVTVDPRDDVQIVDAMRRLLTDDALIAELVAETSNAPHKTWREYADQLWEAGDFAEVVAS